MYYLQSRYYDPNTGRFINADSFASTGQGILGNNTFAYCLNNPINLIDPYGCFGLRLSQRLSKDVSTCSFDDIAGAVLVGCTIAASVAIGSVLAEEFEETAEKIIAWVDAQVTKEDPRENSVYVLKDPSDGNLVKYVGRTNDPIRRLYEHKHDSAHHWRQKYIMTVVATGLTKDEAMVFEQMLISAYTVGYLENARREIAVKNVGKSRACMDATTEIITGLPVAEIKKFISGR